MDAHPDRASRRVRSARLAQRPPRIGATILALGIIFALAYVFVLRAPPSIPTPVIDSIRGTYVLERGGVTLARGGTTWTAATESGSFSALASGDAGGTMRFGSSLQTGDAPSERSSYDASLRTEVTTQVLAAGKRTTISLDAWPPVWRVATLSPLDYQGLAAVVRSAVQDGDRTVGIKPLKEGDRTVWRAAMELDGSTIELVVDQQSGLVVWYSATTGTRTDTFSARPLWGATPSPSSPSDVGRLPATSTSGHVAQTMQNAGYTYAPSTDAAVRAAGYTPLESTLAPDGFTLKAVATTDTGGVPGGWLVPEGPVGPPIDPFRGQRQVAQLYTRGLNWFTVQQLGPKVAGKSVAFLRDTLRSIAADKLSFETTTLQYGAFTGAAAYTWYEKTGPTLFVSDPRHIVYITGALTRQELISFAEGFKPSSQSSIASNSSLSTPQSGQTQSSGRSSQAVPGSTPLSESPTSGS